ncbi:MAG TPA: NmrA family NAD(P)-binding protein [Rhodothermales bacterium]|nr:NmrA family NAD(P)-binding protein [Rhodothermales bacterium]
MKTLIIGGTGTVGSRTVHALLERGIDVRVMTRSEDKIDALPEGAEGIVGDLEAPDTLPAAFDGVDSLFLIAPVSPNETEQGLAGVEAAQEAGIEKIVYMSVAMPDGSERIPHFRSKIPVEDAVRDSGIGFTIVRPNNFFQNDLWITNAILQYGIYPQPIGSAGLNRVDVRDIAEVVARALTQSGHEGKTYGLHGPDVLTGPDCAAIYSRHLGREIRYGGDNLEAWAEQASNMMPNWLVEDMVIMYEYFQQHSMQATDEELAELTDVLGRSPRSYDTFVAEIVPSITA